MYIGPRGCGKSAYVEKQILSSYKELVYIATLPCFVSYHYTINNHVIRRGNAWSTIELSFDFYLDIGVIDKFLMNYSSNSGVLLDGLWTWFSFQNIIGNKISIQEFCDSLIKLIKNSSSHWYLVDISSDQDLENQDIICSIHEKIADEFHIEIFKNKKYGTF
jgi:adenosyl cobinamide kinase/adenosyl cobinamide phosphate guanylyltransferase